MRIVRLFLIRLRNLAFGRQDNQRLSEGMQEHLGSLTEKGIGGGIEHAETRSRAGFKFGSPGGTAGAYHPEHGISLIEGLMRDARFALRQLRRSPGYAATAILTLALGIGANTAIFLLTWSILLKSLPVPHPEQLVLCTLRKGESEIGFSFPQYEAIERQAVAVSGLFAWSGNQSIVRHDGQASKVQAAMVTGSVISVLQVSPMLGRGFAANAGERGADFRPEVMLAYDYWRTQFHSDPAIIGQSLSVDNHNMTIIGVLPRGFNGIGLSENISILLPLSFEDVLYPKNDNTYSAGMFSPGMFWLTVMGRLRPGVNLKQAQADFNAIRNQVNEAADPTHEFLNGGFFGKYDLGVEAGYAGSSWLRWKYTKPLLVLEALCGLMMLLCALNVALLVLSRVSGRVREFAMRNALGASRMRLVAQVLTETLILGACGLAGGSLLGWELARTLVGMITDPVSGAQLQLDAGLVVFGVTSAISLGAALAAAIWPAWRASRAVPAKDLRQSVANSGSHRLGRWIVPAQVALGLVLLNAALLMASTLMTYIRQNSGFNAGNAVLGELDLSDAGVPQKDELARSLDYLRQVQAAPGVQSAALMTMAPIGGSFGTIDMFSYDAKGSLHLNKQMWPEDVSGDYFAVLGTRLLQGRAFTAADESGFRTCILSAAAASDLFPGESALGRRVYFGDGTKKPKEHSGCQVVGVAEDARFASLLEPAPEMVYSPIQQFPGLSSFTVAVRTANADLSVRTLSNVYRREFPGAPLPRFGRFSDVVDHDLSHQRLLASVSSGFALLALTLVTTGLYGILVRTVTEQRREIGIRMALGAQREAIVIALAKSAALRVAMGMAAGALLAAGVGRLVQPLLYGVTPANPWIVLATLTLIAAVLAPAFVIPAIRAASGNPMDAIREE